MKEIDNVIIINLLVVVLKNFQKLSASDLYTNGATKNNIIKQNVSIVEVTKNLEKRVLEIKWLNAKINRKKINTPTHFKAILIQSLILYFSHITAIQSIIGMQTKPEKIIANSFMYNAFLIAFSSIERETTKAKATIPIVMGNLFRVEFKEFRILDAEKFFIV